MNAGASIQTDIRAILPEEKQALAVQEALARANASAANRIAFLVEAADSDVASAASIDLENRLLDSRLFMNDLDEGDIIGRWIFENRRELSCERSPAEFDNELAEKVRKEALARVFGIGSPITGELLKSDPFLLTLRLSECLSPGQASGLGLNQHRITGQLGKPAYELGTQDTLLKLVSDWSQKWVPQGVTLTRSGPVFHAAHAARQAAGEISMIGGAGLAGVVLMFWFVFGRLTSIIATLLLIGASCLSGFGVTLLFFDQVHMLALVFAAMLVGVVADYAVHAMAASTALNWPDMESRLKHLLRPMTISMLTTATGFGGLAFLGVDLFRQLAVFAVSGVATAWSLVLFVYLQLDSQPENASGVTRRWAKLNKVLDRFQPPALVGLGIGLILLAIALTGIRDGRSLDDVRQFQAKNDALMAQEAKMAEVMGAGMDQVFLISQGATLEEARQREEAAIASAPDGVTFLALTRFDPSEQRRKLNEAQLERVLETPFLQQHVAALGVTVSFSETGGGEAAAPGFFEDLQFRGRDGQFYLIARVSGALGWSGPALTGVTLVDAADEYSRAFGRYRELARTCLFIAAAAASLFVVIVYGRLAALSIVAAPFAAMIIGIWLPAFFGFETSFFSMAAGMVLFGVGVDYSAFAWEAAQKRENWTRTSVLVGALTTLLSMGLMTLSGSFPVRSFGLTVSTGVFAALCFAVAPFMFASIGEQNAKRNV